MTIEEKIRLVTGNSAAYAAGVMRDAREFRGDIELWAMVEHNFSRSLARDLRISIKGYKRP